YTQLMFTFHTYVLYLRINTCGTFTRFRFVVIRNRKWGYVIKIAIVLIVGQDKNGFLPYFGILCKDIQDLGYIPCAIPGGAGMIGKILRAGQPGNCRQFTFIHILPELVQNIS